MAVPESHSLYGFPGQPFSLERERRGGVWMRVLTFEKITYIGSMDWKEKMKWKILIILAALVGILIVWCAGKAGEERGIAESEILK